MNLTKFRGGSRPNVLYIIAHDQGIGAACYSGAGPDANPDLPTPNIDALAKRGTIFTNHYGTAPLCSPARASLLTGRFPHQHGLVGLTHRGFALYQGEQTVLHAFNNAGYRTVLIGVQHESRDPSVLGYTDIRATSMGAPWVVLTEDIHDTLSELRDCGQAWWLTLGTEEVHRPWLYKAPPVDPTSVHVPAYLPDTPEVRKDIAELVGVIKSYDEFVGTVMTYLDEFNLRDSTLVIVTTDHGIALPRAKGTLYDPGTHTGMLWSLPGVISEGQRVNALVSSVDFLPSICEFCGVPPPPNLPGLSYAATVLGQAPHNSRSFAFMEKTYHDIYEPIRAIRSSTYKYIRNYEAMDPATTVSGDIQKSPSCTAWLKSFKGGVNPPEELYDLAVDPLETRNLAAQSPPHPELARLRQELDAWLARTPDPIVHGPYPAPAGARVDNADRVPHLKDLKSPLR